MCGSEFRGVGSRVVGFRGLVLRMKGLRLRMIPTWPVSRFRVNMASHDLQFSGLSLTVLGLRMVQTWPIGDSWQV